MDEEAATLVEVLAFLDAFEGDGELQQGEEKLEEVVKPVRSSGTSSLAKKRRVETKYTTNLQRRKRAELSDLREEARTLQARLEHLKQVTQPSEGVDHKALKAKKVWTKLEDKVAIEVEARRRSEKENRKLRVRLDRQAKLRLDIQKLVDKYQRDQGPVDDGRSLVAASKSCTIAGMTTLVTAMATLVPTDSFVAWVPVAMALEQLVSSADSVFGSLFFRPQSCWLEINDVGTMKEVRSSTTSGYSVSMAADMLWCNPDHLPDTMPLVTNVVYANDGYCAVEKSLLPIQCRPWGHQATGICSSVEVVLHIEHYARRVYDPTTRRAVLVTLALIRLPCETGDRVLLREQFWKCITPNGSFCSTSSVTQTNYRIGSGDCCSAPLSPVQTNVMRALAQLTRRNHAAYQDWLLEAAFEHYD